jgi:hypothetical protein
MGEASRGGVSMLEVELELNGESRCGAKLHFMTIVSMNGSKSGQLLTWF